MTMPLFGAGQRVTGAKLKALADGIDTINGRILVASATASDNTPRTTTSAVFTSVLVPAGLCGQSFTAPPSGKVHITWNVDQDNSAAGFVSSAIVIKQGSTIGSGTGVLAADFQTSRMDYNGGQSRATGSHYQSGLVAGAVYNAYLEHLTSAGTGTFVWRSVTVMPVLA